MVRLDELWFTEKCIRAEVVRDYMRENHISLALCFSCGNASEALRAAGVDLLDISPAGDLTANRWFTPAEIARRFPGVFDATSGHLPVWMLTRIAERLRGEINLDSGEGYVIPAGSGETAVCAKIAYPAARIVPEYDDADPATEWNDGAPLNALVRAMFPEVIRKPARPGCEHRSQAGDRQLTKD